MNAQEPDPETKAILDDCVNRILDGGATVEDCLADYPEHAEAIEEHLRTVEQVARYSGFTVSGPSRERIRARLLQELRSVRERYQGEESDPPGSAGSITGRGLLQAALAAVLVMAFLFSGFGVSTASSDAVPGQMLYPAKRSLEGLGIRLEPPGLEKAEMHLRLAARRIEESVSLVLRDSRTAHAATPVQALEDNLIGVVEIARAQEAWESRMRLQSRLTVEAMDALEHIEAGMEAREGEERRRALEMMLRRASALYADAMDSVSVPGEYEPEGQMSVGLRTTRPADVEQLTMKVEAVQAYRTAGAESTWVKVAPGQTIDLLTDSAGIVLPRASLPAGDYSRVRVLVSSVSAVIDGETREVPVNSPIMSVPRPFRIADGDPVYLTLHLDIEGSLKRGSEGYSFAPKVVAVTGSYR